MTRRLTAAVILAARERALATIAGTYQAPAPKIATHASRFSPRVTPRPRELAVRSKGGNPIGPRR